MSIENDPQYFASGYERNRLDRYWTHPWMTEELFRLTPLICDIPQPVWECAAGRGDMSKVIFETGRMVYSTDIDMSEFTNPYIGPRHEKSFLDETEVPTVSEYDNSCDTLLQGDRCKSIITNPPYSKPWRGISDDFVEHGLNFMKAENGIEFMAMLLRSEFKSGKSKRRRMKFGECPFYLGEIVLTTRPRWDYGDVNAPEDAAPRHNFSWFLWKKRESDAIRHPVQFFSYMPRGFKP